ncbi:DUF6364 family protein [Algoriphagus aquimarinus]|uniref:Uncharacterized protein n=1 Tax=Algoriphagus aquimarinus TaxID=237018 RepID=A0A1I1BB87_9BACT|nr:DUF6364 family protein [Algoriphagus aquimarinus]SFB47665.1 hypothetical protein SAMN04489723_11272 [Algoriphagus aquimarinus]|tara:strand:- start:23151 stop:23456 length:306 start_codon:yes stop_codon:yes gene_type:complete
MTTKVTLDINEKLAEKAKKYAEEQGQSLSALVETLLSDVTEPKEKVLEKIKPKNPELVKRILDGTEPIPKDLKDFFGILKGMSEDDVENAKWEHLKEKHGL